MGLQGLALETVGDDGEGCAIAIHCLVDLDARHGAEGVGRDVGPITGLGVLQFPADCLADFADFLASARIAALSGFPHLIPDVPTCGI